MLRPETPQQLLELLTVQPVTYVAGDVSDWRHVRGRNPIHY